MKIFVGVYIPKQIDQPSDFPSGKGKSPKIYLDNDSENQRIVFTNKIKRSKNSEDASSLIGWMEIQSVTILQYCLTEL